MQTARRYYTTFEASHFLGVSLPTVVNWIKANRLRAHRTPGGHRRIARDELASFIRRHGMPMPPELLEEGESARVLLASDRNGAETLAALVREAGFECQAATSAFAAGLAIADFKPDLVVVDLGASGLDGLGAVADLRASTCGARIPAIALGGGRDEKSPRRAMAAGFDDFVPRPLEAEALRRKLGDVLRARRAA